MCSLASSSPAQALAHLSRFLLEPPHLASQPPLRRCGHASRGLGWGQGGVPKIQKKKKPYNYQYHIQLSYSYLEK
jgi:hypothetical protein